MTTVREATFEVLRGLGMPVIFGNPGSSELPFLKDLPADFQYVLALHERSAAGIALGYAMAKGTAAFVNLHSIASAGNGLSAIIDAYYLPRAAGHHHRPAGPPASAGRALSRKPCGRSRKAICEVGVRAAAGGGRSCGNRPWLLPRYATAARAGVHFNSNGRLESTLPVGR